MSTAACPNCNTPDPKHHWGVVYFCRNAECGAMLMKRGQARPRMEAAPKKPVTPASVQDAVTARGYGKAKTGSRPHEWHCLDCKQSTAEDGVNEYYMVTAEVWHSVNPKRRGMLCIGCLEARLGRRLTPEDFTHAPINSIKEWHSERLRSRIEGREEVKPKA